MLYLGGGPHLQSQHIGGKKCRSQGVEARGQSSLQSEFQHSQGHTEKPCLKTNTKNPRRSRSRLRKTVWRQLDRTFGLQAVSRTEAQPPVLSDATRCLVKVPLPRAGPIPLGGTGDQNWQKVASGSLWEDKVFGNLEHSYRYPAVPQLGLTLLWPGRANLIFQHTGSLVSDEENSVGNVNKTSSVWAPNAHMVKNKLT